MKQFVYIATRIETGKAYVGIAAEPAKRWREHCKNGAKGLGQAIRKHGREAFLFEVVACALTVEDACSVEQTLIAELGTLAPGGYNLTTGGERSKAYAPEVRAKMSASLKGNTNKSGTTICAEGRANISASKIGAFQSLTVRRAQGAARKGNTNARAEEVIQFTGLTTEIARFRSIKEASERTGIHRTAIQRACRVPHYHAGGYRWAKAAA